MGTPPPPLPTPRPPLPLGALVHPLPSISHVLCPTVHQTHPLSELPPPQPATNIVLTKVSLTRVNKWPGVRLSLSAGPTRAELSAKANTN